MTRFALNYAQLDQNRALMTPYSDKFEPPTSEARPMGPCEALGLKPGQVKWNTYFLLRRAFTGQLPFDGVEPVRSRKVPDPRQGQDD